MRWKEQEGNRVKRGMGVLFEEILEPIMDCMETATARATKSTGEAVQSWAVEGQAHLTKPLRILTGNDRIDLAV